MIENVKVKKKIKQEFDKKIDNFTKFNKKLKQNHDDLVNIIKDEPLEDEVKAQLNMILDSYNKQMQLNKELSDELINIQKSQDKYKVGHHFGNNSFLRAKKNLKQYKFIKERIPEAVVETETILNVSQVEHLQKIFDTTEKLANELYNLRESDNFLIKSIENKDVKFDELKSAVNEYKTQKERDEFKNEKKLTKDFILTGLKLLSEDYKIWDEGVLAKLNEDKTTNSISKSLINNKDVEVLQTISGLDISKFQQAKNILTKYFTSEGKIIKYKPSLSRSHILNDLKIANDTISEYNKDIVKYSTNLITSLKKKIDTSRILEQTTLLDYSSEKNNYDKLYSAKDEIVTHSSDGNLWELEKVGNIIHKSIDLINKEKNQTASLMTFIDNSLKLKMKNFNGNIDELIEKIKFQTEWSEIKELVNKSNEDLTNVKSLEYISKRNEIINSFVSIKQHINKLKDEAVKFWKYGKQRLGAFKTSYENIKNELDVFNIFDFSYSTISDQLNENKTLLTKNVDKTFETTSDLLEFLNSLMHAKELENVDLKNFNSVKSAIATNINIKLPLAIKIDEKNNVRFKQLSELSDVSSIIQTINLKNNVINELNLAEWNNMNVDEVKKIYTQMFNNILEINLEIPKIVSIKSKYLKYVDEATNIINTYNQSIWDKKSIETIREYLSKTEVEKKVEHWRNIISSTIKKHFINIPNMNEVSLKINNNNLNKIQIFVDYWIKELFDYYYWYEGNKDETDKYLLLIKERKPESYSTMKNVVDTSRKNYQTDIEKAFDIIEKMDLELTNKLISPHNFKNISLTEEALYEILRHELNK